MAALATMLVRYRRFRHILIFERRDWPDRLIFALGLGIPLAAGVVARLLLNYNAADLTLEGAFLAGLIAGPYAGAIVGADGRPAAARQRRVHRAALRRRLRLRRRRPARALPEGSDLALLAVRLHQPAARASGRCCATLQVDWQVVLLLAPVALELLRQALGLRWSAHQQRLFFLDAATVLDARASSCSPRCWRVATPIKIWNNARIEHRLQEQEKLLLAAKIEALANQINPHFLFNTLTSISSLIRTQPDTARMLITKLSGLLRRLMRSTDHFVTLREELDVDRRVSRHRGGPLRPAAAGSRSRSAPDTLDVIVPSMILQPLVENSIKHGLSRKVGGGRITITTACCERPRRSSRCTTMGWG